MINQSLYHTYKRYRTLQTDRILALPIVILMPHSACNCRCVMCDIWKDNQHLKQLTEHDVSGLLSSFRKWGTRQVLMSGGEALLNPRFFQFCELLARENIRVTLLSTGMTLKKNAAQLVRWVHDIIVSIDGDEALHDAIRNVPGSFGKMRSGIAAIRALDPGFPVTARSVIHRLNFRQWPDIIDAAKSIGIDQVSFLPADVSSHAFNREVLWTEARQQDILPDKDDLPELLEVIHRLFAQYRRDFTDRFIAESKEKILHIHQYYAAFYGMNPPPFKKCNAPWVSTVIEADGTVRPCFFHEAFGNIHTQSLPEILNGPKAIRFRRELDIDKNETCRKCVCYLQLQPSMNPVPEKHPA